MPRWTGIVLMIISRISIARAISEKAGNAFQVEFPKAAF